MTLAWSYLTYAVLCVALTIWTGHTLKKRGAVLLSPNCDEELSLALSDLLATGFYLFHIGFALLVLRYGSKAGDLTEAIETVSTKVGFVLLVLAASLFIHLAVFSRLRRAAPAIVVHRTGNPIGRFEAKIAEEPLSAEIVR